MADDDSKGDGFFSWAGNVVNATYQAVIRDGAIGTALIQGRDDAAAAFGRGWQDSVQSNATGSVWDGSASEESRFTVHGDSKDSQAQASATPLPSPSDIAKDRPASYQVAEVEKTFVEKELERREKAGGNGGSGDQNELERARILPIEQQQEKGNERGR